MKNKTNKPNRQTLGKMTKTRNVAPIPMVTRVKESKKAYNRARVKKVSGDRYE